ncbi:MAG: PHA/PHB synthase family protein, partial [Pseudomonadales bacterium]
MSSDEKQMEQDVANAASALSPLLGFDIDDIRIAYNDLLAALIRHPRLAAKALSSITSEQLEILINNADWKPNPKDKRFSNPAWQDNRYFRTILQFYFASAQGMRSWLKSLKLEDVESKRAEFLFDLLEGALAPSNFLLSNPEGFHRARETRGVSVAKSVRNLLRDWKDNQGFPSQADRSKFKYGENIATLAGAVIYKNELLELIQYKPATAKVYEKPLFFSTSMVNKYYLCDLMPHRSLFKFIVDHGFTLFAVSWRNPTAEHRDLGMEAYVTALIAAIQVTCKIVGRTDLNAIGLCGGGSVLSTALAYLAKKRGVQSSSLTLLVNVLDNHSDDTELGAVTTEAMVESAKSRSWKKGLYSRQHMLLTFSLMKADAMIWPFIVRNYVLGEEPPESEVLFWTADQTGLPAAMHADMLDMMLNNSLVEGSHITVRGTTIDLSSIHCDAYILG